MELQFLPVRVDHRVNVIVVLRSAMQAEGQAVGVIGQVSPLASTIPVDIFAPEPTTTQPWMGFAKRNHALEETEDVLICGKLAPVEPSRGVVLVVGIVVAELRVQGFIASAKHWSPVRQH